MDDLASIGYDFEGTNEAISKKTCQKWGKAQVRAEVEASRDRDVIRYSGLYLLKGQTWIHGQYQDKFMRLNIPTKVVNDHLFLITDIYLLTKEEMTLPGLSEKEILALYTQKSRDKIVFLKEDIVEHLFVAKIEPWTM